MIEEYTPQTLTLLFNQSEIDHCQTTSNPHQSYALCFATKEAVGKALGTGLVGIDWNEIEAKIINGKLSIDLHGKASIQAKRLGISQWWATWTNWDQHIIVQVFAL